MASESKLSKLHFSRIVLGTMRMTEWGAKMTWKEADQLLRKCLAFGITTLDTADIYGNYTVESLLGEVFQHDPQLREQFQIVTKCGIKLVCAQRPQHKLKCYDSSKEHILASVKNSLDCMKTNYIDVLLLHRFDPLGDPDEIAEAFTWLKKEGWLNASGSDGDGGDGDDDGVVRAHQRPSQNPITIQSQSNHNPINSQPNNHPSGQVRHFGVSNYSPSQFHLLQSRLPKDIQLCTNQVQCSVLHPEVLTDGTIDVCVQYGIQPMAWSPLAGGILMKSTDERTTRARNVLKEIGHAYDHATVDQMAIAWLLAHPSKMTVVYGTSNVNRLESASKALQIKMTREEWFRVLEACQGREVP